MIRSETELGLWLDLITRQGTDVACARLKTRATWIAKVIITAIRIETEIEIEYPVIEGAGCVSNG
jgi:hypothetical protein